MKAIGPAATYRNGCLRPGDSDRFNLHRLSMTEARQPRSTAVDKFFVPWETVGMSEKRTKADKAQRQADQLEKKLARRPAQTRNKQRSPDGGKRAPAQTSR